MKWKIPYIGFNRQFENLKEGYIREFKKVMKKGDFVLRNDVRKFEKNMSKFLKVKYVVSVNSCSDALLLSLGSLGLKKNSEVICVAHTYVATLSAIVHVGLKPVLVDIGEDYNIDVEKIEKHITKKTKVILPVHLYGRSCNMDRVMQIAKKYNLIVVEDVAQSFGAKYKNKMAGTFGTAGCFSLHPIKSFGGAGDGGFITTNNKKIYEKIFRHRNHAQGKRKSKILEMQRYDIEHYGVCSRLDNLQAALLNIKFQSIRNFIKKRRKIASIYSSQLNNLPLKLPSRYINNKNFDVYNSYVIRTNKRKKLFEYLRRKKIEVLIYWPKPLYKHRGLKLGSKILPESEKICKEIISLPIYPEMSMGEINFVVKSIKNFFNKN